MGFFDWLFRKPGRPAAPAPKRYAYPTGNVELATRVGRGEFLMAVIADIKPRWTPGNEYLWDEYDPESLLDTPEKARYLVNALLFGRVVVYRRCVRPGATSGAGTRSSSRTRSRRCSPGCGADSRACLGTGRAPG
jgi:hypothetical protein